MKKNVTIFPVRTLKRIIWLVICAGIFPIQLASAQAPNEQDLKNLIRASKARAAVVKKVSKSVVHISVRKASKESTKSPQDEFMRRFFPPGITPRQQPEQNQSGLGSGFVVDSKGHILTNNHVVSGATEIIVKFEDGKQKLAKLVGVDPPTDLAVLKIEQDNLPVAALGSSDDIQVGETVLAIGNPFGFEQTVTQGIVSAKGRSQIGVADYEDFIQTDASINPGNSGGPLINLRGEVIGVNTGIFSRSGGNLGIGFAIPIKMARRVMISLIKTGKVTRGFLGVVIQDVNKELSDALGVEEGSGVLVANVGARTPASKAGIQQGDVILSFNKERVTRVNDLRNKVAAVSPGNRVPVVLLRNKKRTTLSVLIEVQPSNLQAAVQSNPSTEQRDVARAGIEAKLGLVLANLTSELKKSLQYQGLQGVVVRSVRENSAAANAGIRQGTLIVEADKVKVRSVAEFRKVLKRKPSGSYLLLLAYLGKNNVFFIGLPIP